MSNYTKEHINLESNIDISLYVYGIYIGFNMFSSTVSNTFNIFSGAI